MNNSDNSSSFDISESLDTLTDDTSEETENETVEDTDDDTSEDSETTDDTSYLSSKFSDTSEMDTSEASDTSNDMSSSSFEYTDTSTICSEISFSTESSINLNTIDEVYVTFLHYCHQTLGQLRNTIISSLEDVSVLGANGEEDLFRINEQMDAIEFLIYFHRVYIRVINEQSESQ